MNKYTQSSKIQSLIRILRSRGGTMPCEELARLLEINFIGSDCKKEIISHEITAKDLESNGTTKDLDLSQTF